MSRLIRTGSGIAAVIYALFMCGCVGTYYYGSEEERQRCGTAQLRTMLGHNTLITRFDGIKMNEYIVEAPAGRHIVEVRFRGESEDRTHWSDNRLELTMEPGRAYYIQYDVADRQMPLWYGSHDFESRLADPVPLDWSYHTGGKEAVRYFDDTPEAVFIAFSNELLLQEYRRQLLSKYSISLMFDTTTTADGKYLIRALKPGYGIDIQEIGRFLVEPAPNGRAKVILQVDDYYLRRFENFLIYVFERMTI